MLVSTFRPITVVILHLFEIPMSTVITSVSLLHHHMPRTQSGTIVKIASNRFGAGTNELE